MIRRRRTRPVRVGEVVIGGGAPIVVQSMTTTSPEDLEGSLAQIRALQAAGCEIVRLAVPSIEAARALGPLREAMRAGGIDVPLSADVHFNPRAAYEAARHVEKVRINPGNFAPSPEEARRRLSPLLDLLRERGTALRIGVNHGSLAPHISAAYGHGPRGMVLSAVEYARICRDAGFEQLVVALKASNPAVMVAANRLLAETMRAEGMDYPIHLGVTEAGAEEEGVLRSALGIGALLLEGIGDTIRVSLTGDPVAEIDACRRILGAVEAEAAGGPGPRPPAAAAGPPTESIPARWGVLSVGGSKPPRVEIVLRFDPAREDQRAAAWERLARLDDPAGPEPPIESVLVLDPEFVLAAADDTRPAAGGDTQAAAARLRGGVWADALLELRARVSAREPRPAIWMAWPAEALPALPEEITAVADGLHLIVGNEPDLSALAHDVELAAGKRPGLLLRWHIAGTQAAGPAPVEVPTRPVETHPVVERAADTAQQLVRITRAAGLPAPAVAWSGEGMACVGRALAARVRVGAESEATSRPVLLAWMPADPVRAAVALGPLLLDGQIDALIAEGPDPQPAYDLLQITRRRLLRAEFISCPGCGRLAYDLEGAVRRLKAKFGHLVGVKIAVMGCSVNGPGEMADADVGYVGSVAGKVDVYAGRERVGRALDPVQADALLGALLQSRGLWREPTARERSRG